MWRVAVTLLVAMALAGCGPMFESKVVVTGAGDYGYGIPSELGPLLDRRDVEVVLADRDLMMTQITAELSRVVPGTQWQPEGESTYTPCGAYGSTDGRTYVSPHYVSKVPIPVDLWDRASQAVVDVAARHGYTKVTSRTQNASADQAANLEIADGEGGVFTLLSLEATSMYVKTGCHLTADDKRKARDAAPSQ